MTHHANGLKTSPQFFNCALHVLVPYLVAFIKPEIIQTQYFKFNEVKASAEKRKQFKKTKGYQYFLDAFSDFYRLKKDKKDKKLFNKLAEKVMEVPTHLIQTLLGTTNGKIENLLDQLLEKFPHPLDLQVLLGPVLRLMLRKVLLEDKKHEEAIKESFKVILNKCLEKFEASNHSSQILDIQYKIRWLEALQWDQSEEHEELLKPNIKLIAELLGSKNPNFEPNWKKLYLNYCLYQSSPSQCVFISESQLALLCHSFNFAFAYKQGEALREEITVTNPLAKVMAFNKSQDHWEILPTVNNTWNYIEQPEQSAFSHYHQVSLELVSQGVDPLRIKELQKIYRKKIHRFLIDEVEYKEDFFTILPMDNWANNGSLEGLVAIIIKYVLEKNLYEEQKQTFSLVNTKGFKQFLETFRAYYGLCAELSFEKTIASLKFLLSSYSARSDQNKLLSPVLRTMLGHVGHKQISLSQLKTLSDQFNIYLEIYKTEDKTKISHFKRGVKARNNGNYAAILPIALFNDECLQIQKDTIEAQVNSVLEEKTTTLLSKECTVSIAQALQNLQSGIQSLLKTGILYSQVSRPSITIPQQKLTFSSSIELEPLHLVAANGTEEELAREIATGLVNINQQSKYRNIPLQGLVQSYCSNFTALHFAICVGNFQNVKYLLAQQADWRIKAQWTQTEITSWSNPFSTEHSYTCLDLAVYLDDRRIVSLILRYASEGRDDWLVQEAYDRACRLGKTNVLHAFLAYSSIKHSKGAIQNAIKNQDFVLLQWIFLTTPHLSKNLLKLPILLNMLTKDQFSDLTEDQSESRLTLCNFILNLSIQYHIKTHFQNEDHFKVDDSVLEIVDLAFKQRYFKWIDNLARYLDTIVNLKYDLSALTQIVQENSQKIAERIAKHACQAIKENNYSMLDDCLIANKKCILISGKYSVLHAAVRENRFKETIDHLVKFLSDFAKNKMNRPISAEEDKQFREFFENLKKVQVDECERTLDFRIQRKEYQQQLMSEFEKASLLSTDKLFLLPRLAKFKVDSVLYYCQDGLYSKARHSSIIQRTNIWRYGYPILGALKTVGVLATAGVPRYALGLSWYWLPTFFKQPILSATSKCLGYGATYVGFRKETAEFYISQGLDNGICLLLMPEYYLISTALNTGVYYAFKDSGRDNWEAFTTLLVDGIACSLSIGSSGNYPIDERYQYHLNKNLQAFLGESVTTQIAPVISLIDSLSISLNELINFPVDYLSVQYGGMTSTYLGQLATSTNQIIDTFPFGSTVRDNLMSHYEQGKEFLRLKAYYGERMVDYLESWILYPMADSSYKFERLMVHQMRINQPLGLQKAELEERLHLQNVELDALKQELDQANKGMKVLNTIEKFFMQAFGLRPEQISNALMRAWYDFYFHGECPGAIELEDGCHLFQNVTNEDYATLAANQKSILNNANEAYQISLGQRDETQQALSEISSQLETSFALEQSYFKQTVGYAYYEDWNDKYVKYKYGDYDSFKSDSEKQKLKEEADSALEQSRFFNIDEVNRTAEQWGHYVDELFQKHRRNFPDWSANNGNDVIYGIIDAAMSISTDRSEIAKFCADEIIRYKYPLYPEVGDAKIIEAERLKYRDDIYEYELNGYQRKPERVKKRLFNFVHEKLTDIPRQRHRHRHERIIRSVTNNIVKPFINEVCGGLIGWVPYKNVPGGRNGVGNHSGNINFQFGFNTDGTSYQQVRVANTPIYTAQTPSARLPAPQYSSPGGTIEGPRDSELLLQDSELTSNLSIPPIEASKNPALELDSTYMASIMDEQLAEIFDSGKNKTRARKPSVPTATIRPIKPEEDEEPKLPSKEATTPELELLSRPSEKIKYDPIAALEIYAPKSNDKVIVPSPKDHHLEPQKSLVTIGAVGAVRGSVTNLKDTFDMALHPVDSAKDIGELLWDLGNLASDKMFDISNEEARERNHARGVYFSNEIKKFKEGSKEYQTQKTSELIGSMFGPQVFFKVATGLKILISAGKVGTAGKGLGLVAFAGFQKAVMQEESRLIASSKRLSSNSINAKFINEKALREGWYPPFPPDTVLREIVLSREMKFYRVHTNPAKPAGGFIAREKEIASFLNNPEALRLHLGLPDVPIYITEVNVPAGTSLVVGRIGPQPNYGLMQNSGFQYYLMEQLDKSFFVNTRLILEPKLIANRKHKLTTSMEY